MPALPWFARVVSATFVFAVNLAIVTGVFLFSANLAAQPDVDARNGALFVRALASAWLYVAAWSWVVRGLLQRPPKPLEKGKLSRVEALKGGLGCVAHLVPIAIAFVVVGPRADSAWAGITGPDPGHPARVALDRFVASALYLVDHSDRWLPWVPWAVAGVVLFTLARGVIGASRRMKDVRRRDVQSANEATLANLRKKRQPGNKGQSDKKGPVGGREILAPAGAASAATIGAAHEGAHGPDMSRFKAASGAREDRVLGALTFSSSDGAWWAHREDGAFPVQLEGPSEGPDPHALDLARQTVQRSFEVLLRASDAARPLAQKRGVGLPRFTIRAVRVGAGGSPDVTVHLRSDGDPGHEYVVRSSDKLETFLGQ